MAQAESPADAQQPLRTSALFLLGAVSVRLIGTARTFVAQYLDVRVPVESASWRRSAFSTRMVAGPRKSGAALRTDPRPGTK